MDDENPAIYQLLLACAHAESRPEHHRQLAKAAGCLPEWEGVVTRAEAHGMAPLFYSHLLAAGVHPPDPIKRQLQGLYLRHQQANRIRTRTLAEILNVYRAAAIPVLVLKGAALAHFVYGQPGLRPMRDIDILVHKSDARRAQQRLAELGFYAPLPGSGRLPDKHLAVASRPVAGMTVSVEIHHNLFDASYPASLELSDLVTEPLRFSLADTGVEAQTLGYEEMLWHLCQHMTLNATVFQRTRLIWIADIVSFAERFALVIDWRRVERRYPLVMNTLSLLNTMSPLSASLQERIGLKSGAVTGIGLDFQGWPRASLAAQRAKGYRRILRDTFLPSQWWLRLHYGLGSSRSLFWHRWLIHPLHILGWATHELRYKFSRKALQEKPRRQQAHRRA